MKQLGIRSEELGINDKRLCHSRESGNLSFLKVCGEAAPKFLIPNF